MRALLAASFALLAPLSATAGKGPVATSTVTLEQGAFTVTQDKARAYRISAGDVEIACFGGGSKRNQRLVDYLSGIATAAAENPNAQWGPVWNPAGVLAGSDGWCNLDVSTVESQVRIRIEYNACTQQTVATALAGDSQVCIKKTAQAVATAEQIGQLAAAFRQ